LNDTQFVEASRAFAQRILRQRGGGQKSDAEKASSDADLLRYAFLESLSRLPSDHELNVVSASLARERQRYQADDKLARAYLSIGESPRDENIPVAEHAAWSQVAALLLNLSEAVTRN
jgi:hypothetical protein